MHQSAYISEKMGRRGVTEAKWGVEWRVRSNGGIRSPQSRQPVPLDFPPEWSSFSVHLLLLTFAFLLLSIFVSFISVYATVLINVRFTTGSPSSRAISWLFQRPTGQPLSFSLPLFLPAPLIYCMEFQAPGQLLFHPLKALAKGRGPHYCSLKSKGKHSCPTLHALETTTAQRAQLKRLTQSPPCFSPQAQNITAYLQVQENDNLFYLTKGEPRRRW